MWIPVRGGLQIALVPLAARSETGGSDRRGSDRRDSNPQTQPEGEYWHRPPNCGTITRRQNDGLFSRTRVLSMTA